MSQLLDLLKLEASPASIDYVAGKQQFHLYSLQTEQRHPKTWNLSFVLQSDTEAGLRMLLSVDRDISERIRQLQQDVALLEQAAAAIVRAVLAGRKIYVYGCGATGRLAKQMESTFWRPFWKKVKQRPCWARLRARVGDDIEDALTGEMTGADRALVSSLEGFEDLQLIGRLQLQDHGIRRGDVVICVTEGGETSSVIGTILAALDQYGPIDEAILEEARSNLYFICNNPVSVLLPFERSAAVLHNPAITHIDLTTGPQAITGSTRMQATTIETFVVGVILEEALERVLETCLDRDELRGMGFGAHSGLSGRLADFETARQAVETAAGEIAGFTDLEQSTYRRNRFATYLANRALITVFIDSTERSPTFRLYPLDKVEDPQRRCWAQVWTEAHDLHSAWRSFLGRPFRGLDPSRYGPAFAAEVQDPYLREAALRSLQSAGNDQEFSYDFSFAGSNIERRGPAPGDLGVLVLMDEETRALDEPESGCRRFIELFHDRGAALAILTVSGKDDLEKLRHSISPLSGAGGCLGASGLGFPRRSAHFAPPDRTEDAAQRPFDRRHGRAGPGYRQHHDQREPEQPQAHRQGDLSDPFPCQRHPGPAGMERDAWCRRADHVCGGQCGPDGCDRFRQIPRDGSDGGGGIEHHPDCRSAGSRRERRLGGSPADPGQGRTGVLPRPAQPLPDKPSR